MRAKEWLQLRTDKLFGDAAQRVGLFCEDVGSKAGDLFHSAYCRVKIFFGALIGLLVMYEAVIVIGFLFYRRSVQRIADLVVEKIHGGSVAYQVVDILEQMAFPAGLDHLEAGKEALRRD